MFYFVRHGKTDYSEKDTKIYQGMGVNLAKLSEKGIAQIKEAAKDERLANAELILCSPYTRAVHSAAILSKELGVELAIETDLHEWLANKNYIYVEDDIAEQAYREYESNQGSYLAEEKDWEDAEAIKKRVFPVLEKYISHQKIIVVCHGMMIQAITGSEHPECGEIVVFDWETKKKIECLAE